MPAKPSRPTRLRQAGDDVAAAALHARGAFPPHGSQRAAVSPAKLSPGQELKKNYGTL